MGSKRVGGKCPTTGWAAAGVDRWRPSRDQCDALGGQSRDRRASLDH
jgi:hypothetical protein